MSLSQDLRRLQQEMQETDRQLARLIGQHIDDQNQALKELVKEIEGAS